MNWFKREKTGEKVRDPQSGRIFELETEAKFDTLAAQISFVYLLAMLLLIGFLLVDLAIGEKQIIKFLNADPVTKMNYKKSEANSSLRAGFETISNDSIVEVTNSTEGVETGNGSNSVASIGEKDASIFSLVLLIMYAAIGGGLGAVAKGIRSCVFWHLHKRAFGWRYIWKYITLPPLGAILAVIVYAITRSGLATVGGEISTEGDSAFQILSAFALGSLSGFGTHAVAEWLDDKINKVFSFDSRSETAT